MLNGDLVNLFTKDANKMFTRESTNMLTSDLANMFTSGFVNTSPVIQPKCLPVTSQTY